MLTHTKFYEGPWTRAAQWRSRGSSGHPKDLRAGRLIDEEEQVKDGSSETHVLPWYNHCGANRVYAHCTSE